ncbi:protein kinase, partial [Candidatus Woesearchaeota archaeon]|nr:protein kinase [Candidatus Woesearchaeota archaeon]
MPQIFADPESEGESEVVEERSSEVVEKPKETEAPVQAEKTIKAELPREAEQPKTAAKEQSLELSGMLERTRTANIDQREAEKDPIIGRKVGKFTLTERLGQGGFGVVYKAENNGTVVALKRPKDKLGQKAIDALMREANVTKRLKHPNIVGVEELVQDNGDVYLRLPYVDAKPLDVTAERSLNEKLKIVYKISKALEYAHSQGVTYQDIKPGNILVNEKGEVFIVDFGLAKAKKEHMQNSMCGQSVVSITGPIGGTLDYMSPEQRKGEDIDHRADVYGLSVLLYKLLSRGQSPGGSVGEELIEDGVSKGLAEVVAKGTKRDKNKRWDSINEFLKKLVMQKGFLGEKVEGTNGWYVS